MARKTARAAAPTLPIHVISQRTLPPTPSSAGNPYRLLFHPEEKTLWLLALDSQQVFRVADDGTGTLVCSGAALGLPPGFDARYVHEVAFYYDTARRAPVWLVSTYDSRFGDGLLLGVWKDGSFSALTTKNGIEVASSDGFVFDPARGVLVHFAGQRDRDVRTDEARKKRGGLTARELGLDGAWRDVGEPLLGAGTYETHAGWDERRKLAVFLDSDTQETWGWDGAAFRALGRFPSMAWKPWAMTIAPHTKALVYLHAPRASDDYRARLWELGEEGWIERDAHAVEAFGGGAHDSARGVSYFYGPWFGPGTVQTTLGRYDGAELVPAGQPSYPFSRGSASGTPLFSGAREPGHGNYARAVRRPYAAHAIARLVQGALQSLPPSPPVIGVIAGAGGVHAVGFTGEVFALTGGGWDRVGKAPKGFVERERANLGGDARGRVLLTGGQPIQGTKNLTDAWLFDGGKWTEIVARGPAPVAMDAAVGFDPARGAWVIVGGKLKNYQPSPKTYEYDGKKWSSFPTTGKEATSGSPLLLAWDEPSAQLLLVTDYGYVLVYRGSGEWQHVASLHDLAGPAVAYDTARRALVIAGSEMVTEVALGPTLDASKPAVAPDEGRAEKKPKPAKTAPKAEETIGSAVWLKLQQGEHEKFWFAARKGPSWTARWGRRGAKALEKTHTLADAAAAKAAYEKAVRAKLAQGYEPAPEKEAAAVIPGTTSFRMKLGSKGDDDFGGLPAGVTEKAWPVCADCSHPMMHVLTLHAHPERLPLRKHAAIALFTCFSEDGTCETWDEDAGCNAALLLTAAALRKKPLRAPPTGPNGEAAPEVMRARKIAYRPAFEADPGANDNAEDVPFTSKVGGYPAWIQFPQTPACPTCDKEMNFVAQLQEIDDALNFGSGDGYLFCCPDEHAAKFLWQR